LNVFYHQAVTIEYLTIVFFVVMVAFSYLERLPYVPSVHISAYLCFKYRLYLP
jgi:hypothetical protein